MKLGKKSVVLTPLRPLVAIAGADLRLASFLEVNLALFFGVLLFFEGTLRRRLPLRNRFLLPRGKNLPFLSRGKFLANFLPLATRLADLRLRFLGMTSNAGTPSRMRNRSNCNHLILKFGTRRYLCRLFSVPKL